MFLTFTYGPALLQHHVPSVPEILFLKEFAFKFQSDEEQTDRNYNTVCMHDNRELNLRTLYE